MVTNKNYAPKNMSVMGNPVYFPSVDAAISGKTYFC